MNTLSQQFNAQAHWSLYIAPLLMLLILDDIARRETRRRKRISTLQGMFYEKSVAQSQTRYHRQITDMHPPRQVAGPRL